MSARRTPASAHLTRPQRQQRTRSRLLGAAAAVFARRGMMQASIDEVAAEAGFTKGAFYANFSSKEALFLAMLDERFGERLVALQRLTAGSEELEVQAREAGREFAEHLEADPSWQRLFFEFTAYAGRNEPFRAELVSRYRALREGMAAAFGRRVEALELPAPVAMDDLALMTFAMANGFALERLLEPEDAPPELFGTMLVIFFAGLEVLAQRAMPTAAQAPTEARRN